MKRRYFLQSFGCQMNDYDVGRMRELLRGEGYEPSDSAEAADVILIDTCAIREKAEAKTASTAGRYRLLKEQRPELVLGIVGCVAQLEGDRLLRQLPYVDLVLGPDHIPRLGELIAGVQGRPRPARRHAYTEVTDVEAYEFLDADPRPGDVRVTALVTIQKGCDNECAYCIVPTTRGREVSRPADQVLAEVERFVAAGAREVTLIGQNVNAYHGLRGGREDFADLLARVAEVAGLLRLRYTTSHPMDFTERVAEAHRDLPTLCRWLHLPVQSGSSRTLARMKRGYTRDEYLRKVEHLRALCPDISLTSDVIVGYPGETEADHAETLSLLREVEYDGIYSFAYSPRPGTPALDLGDDVPGAEKSRRLAEVQAVQRDITARRLARFVGRVEPVLVEGESRGVRSGSGTGEPQLCGRTSGNQTVNFPAPDGAPAATLAGALLDVRITEARAHTLVGVPAGAPPIVSRPARRALPLLASA